jgi:hypothetical protein
LRRLVALVLLSGARRSPVFFLTKISRWERGTVGRAGEAFFNKRRLDLLCLWSMLLLSLLASHGGVEKGSLPASYRDGGGGGVHELNHVPRDLLPTWR